MATLTKGKTFTNGELVTPASLHALVDSAAVANIVNADIAAGAAIADTKLATISTANKVAQSAVTNLTTELAGKAASSHAHTIANVTGLQTALDVKQASGSYAPATGIAQSAVTNLTTDLAGKAAASHTHTIANVTGLQTALDGKQASGSYAPATGIAPSAITGTAVITTDSRLVPAGAVMPFAMNSEPSGWLQANGDLVSRSTYSALFSAIGTTYGSGDGSTTFNLPDLRGYFLRGSGTNIDGTASGNFGSRQSDDVKPHTHQFSLSIQSLVLSVQAAFGTRSTGGSQAVSDINVSTGSPSVSASISSNIGVETRPKNIAMMYCIKT